MTLKEVAIIIDNLTKRFEDVTAVDGLSLEVEKGELFGLLGPNGAGKTTTINVLCGLLEPTSGSVRVGSYDVRKEPEKVKELIGAAVFCRRLLDALSKLLKLDSLKLS